MSSEKGGFKLQLKNLKPTRLTLHTWDFFHNFVWLNQKMVGGVSVKSLCQQSRLFALSVNRHCNTLLDLIIMMQDHRTNKRRWYITEGGILVEVFAGTWHVYANGPPGMTVWCPPLKTSSVSSVTRSISLSHRHTLTDWQLPQLCLWHSQKD